MDPDAATLRELIDSGRSPRLLDVRTPAEFETAHIPGAYNVPLDLLREHRDELRNHLAEDVVLICRSGVRAGQAGQALAGAGPPNLTVLDGGMLARQATAAPVTQGRRRWDVERQVRLVAGSIVLLSVLGSGFVPGLKWVVGFIGAGLTFAAVSNTCAMGMLLSRLPYNRGASCDLDTRRPADRFPVMTVAVGLTVGLAVLIGASLGLLGGGGSILAVPLLVYVAGLPAKEAIATSLLVVGVTSAVALLPHARAGRVRWRTGLIFGVAGMTGAYAGGRLAGYVPSAYLLTGFALMMLATAVAMIRGRRAGRLRASCRCSG
ncbi:Rhodanese-related sulfurtransferase [Micromonospora narathiwatensis]|uniref:Probable membrane transporter protein n=1 Tax=Micromonospora narathiwatensis TaxID=299146 RepID=A0A1A8ZBI6_9ACTN|nr:Rhodanese-related sulfurtransferase [Micromonospora narathiwatensis]